MWNLQHIYGYDWNYKVITTTNHNNNFVICISWINQLMKTDIDYRTGGKHQQTSKYDQIE